MHNSTRRLLKRVRKVTRDLVPSLWAQFPRKCTKKHCNLCKKNGGAYTTYNTKDVVGTRKTEQKDPISTPPRKVERNLIPQSTLSCS
jgi:hypothetical protein